MSGGPTPPLVCRPHPVARPWGGSSAPTFADLAAQPGQRVGEWWLLSTRADHTTLVANAPFAERPLSEVVAADPERILGARFARSGRFPLLIKILDTAEPLSVQVHPSSGPSPAGAAARTERKTETWYVLDAAPGANYWVGLAEGATLESFFAAARRGEDPLPQLARREARRGAVVHLHAGVIHALGGGIVALEVQTNADTTYRIWDFARKPARELQIDLAQAAAAADQRAELPEPQTLPPASPPRELLVRCDDYRIERLRLSAPSQFAVDRQRFEVLVPLGAAMRVAGEHGVADVPRGHAVLIPAHTSEFMISPSAPLELLRVIPTGEGTP
jgi:mannose-6-phosphate isomerase